MFRPLYQGSGKLSWWIPHHWGWTEGPRDGGDDPVGIPLGLCYPVRPGRAGLRIPLRAQQALIYTPTHVGFSLLPERTLLCSPPSGAGFVMAVEMANTA